MGIQYDCYTLTVAKPKQSELEQYMAEYLGDINYEMLYDINVQEFITEYGEIFDNVMEIQDKFAIRFFVEVSKHQQTEYQLTFLPKSVTAAHVVINYVEEEVLNQYKKTIKLTSNCFINTDKGNTELDTDKHIIYLSPKNSFGTGDHATTQLAAQLLEQYTDSTDSLIDVGCGTGILAIYAAKIGMSHILAVDSDPQAIVEANTVIANNDVTAVVQTQVNNFVDDIPVENYTCVIANLSLNLYDRFFTSLGNKAYRNQKYIFSGLQVDEQETFLALLEKYDFDIHTEIKKEGWIAFYGYKQ